MSGTAVSSLGFIGAVVAIMVDGRRAVVVAATALALGLAPSAASQGGDFAVILLIGCAVVSWAAALAGGGAGRRLHRVPGLDPQVPVLSPAHALFGPRSLRATAACLALPVASWVSFNVPVGGAATVRGLLFPAAYGWCCGALRLVLAGSVTDLAVGATLVAFSGAGGALLRGGAGALLEASSILVLSPLAAFSAAWLGGRHARREAAGP